MTFKGTYIFGSPIVFKMDSLNCDAKLGKVWALQEFETRQHALRENPNISFFKRESEENRNNYLDH